MWADNKDGRPKSYLLSLLVITAYARVPAANLNRRLKTYAHKLVNEYISPVYTRLLTRVGIRVKLIRVHVDTPNPDSNPG